LEDKLHFKRDLSFGSEVDAKTLTDLLDPFVGTVKVLEWSSFENAWENLAYRCVTDVGSFVVRISTMPDDSPYREVARVSLERELLFTKLLRAEGVPAVKFVENESTGHIVTDFVQSGCRRFVMVQELVSGISIGTSAEELRAMALVQASMHEASAWVTLPEVPLLDSGYSVFADRQQLLDDAGASSELLTSLEAELAMLHKPIVDAVVRHRSQRTLIPIHADLTTANVLHDGQGVVTGVLDFNDCRLGTTAEDIGTTLWSLGDVADDPGSVALSYLESYKSVGALSEQDQLTAVQYAIDRYLVINRHYLRQHPAGSDELAAQEKQAMRQLATIRSFMVAFDIR
jgi:Ser/Thr protein kinase RdoA (MazF antagonist)